MYGGWSLGESWSKSYGGVFKRFNIFLQRCANTILMTVTNQIKILASMTSLGPCNNYGRDRLWGLRDGRPASCYHTSQHRSALRVCEMSIISPQFSTNQGLHVPLLLGICPLFSGRCDHSKTQLVVVHVHFSTPGVEAGEMANYQDPVTEK